MNEHGDYAAERASHAGCARIPPSAAARSTAAVHQVHLYHVVLQCSRHIASHRVDGIPLRRHPPTRPRPSRHTPLSPAATPADATTTIAAPVTVDPSPTTRPVVQHTLPVSVRPQPRTCKLHQLRHRSRTSKRLLGCAPLWMWRVCSTQARRGSFVWRRPSLETPPPSGGFVHRTPGATASQVSRCAYIYLTNCLHTSIIYYI